MPSSKTDPQRTVVALLEDLPSLGKEVSHDFRGLGLFIVIAEPAAAPASLRSDALAVEPQIVRR